MAPYPNNAQSHAHIMICKPIFHSVWALRSWLMLLCSCLGLWIITCDTTMMVLMWGSFCKTDSSLSASGGRWRWCEACCNGMLAILCWCHYWCYMVLLCRSTTMVMLECLRGEVFANQSLPPVGCGVANTLSFTPISINLSCRISSPHIIFPQFCRVFLQFCLLAQAQRAISLPSVEPIFASERTTRSRWYLYFRWFFSGGSAEQIIITYIKEARDSPKEFGALGEGEVLGEE